MADELTPEQLETVRRILTNHARVCESTEEFVKFSNDVEALINVPDGVIAEEPRQESLIVKRIF